MHICVYFVTKFASTDEDIDEDYEDEIMLDIGEVNTTTQDSMEVSTAVSNNLFPIPRMTPIYFV